MNTDFQCSRWILLTFFISITTLTSFSNGSQDEKPVDFIVVGAGAAGCVVAHRLSEKFSVLLLESGGEPDPDLDIPAKTPNFFNNDEYVKSYKSVAQSNAGLMNNGVFTYLVGRTLGGGTSINGQVYNRGSPYDYDNWANITEDSSWSYSNMLEHFKRIEDYAGDFPSQEQHGVGGPIPISRPKYAPGLNTWLEAGKELGYSVADPSGPQTVSFSPLEFSRSRGKRVSAYQGYIQPFLSTRKHLKLIKNAEVTKILFEGNKAVGVEYTVKGEKEAKVALVSKEVILSAGVLSTPVILMKSGIGPREVLESSKIPPVKYLPVGRNFQDHIFLQIHFTLKKNKADLFVPERDLTPEALELLEETGDGPFSTYNGVLAQAFLVSSVRAKEKEPNPNWADINLHLVQTPSRFGVDGMAEVDEDSIEDTDITSISTVIMVSRPKSRGTVTLNAEDIHGDPLVDFQYLTHPDDLEIMVDAVKQVLKLHEETLPYKKQDTRYATTPLQFCTNHTFGSDDYWKCYINHMSAASAHGAGTCRMGNGPQDPNAVVDSKLKVIGILNLRVVDTSIMPSVTNSNTQAPAYVIGEKAASDILKDWKSKTSNERQEL